MELIGKIIQVLPLQEGVSKAGNAWKKQEYILETLGTQYPRKVCFNLFGDNVDKFPMQVGQDVTVSIDLESREFNGRWYTDVRAWNVLNGVQLAGAPAPGFATAPTQPTPATPPAQPAQASPVAAPTAADDLPF
ncbi:DUF3127 domain-containing protein [Porphyromonas catoniae]|jgi:hypothetical protein|uniref:PF11325 domain protein n=3 Tax=Porphyromonas catoniae TaxID=41976 RepID=Z4WQN2_9PORP|nr:DUF3127 domain-containing protein [Porphyromonas catoniae]EKY02722.1 hypothetical protein HMPREF9134_00264 [Porphyromonas catoniae F0037]EWC91851.1 PF11325 domain protein [Porphyromonas catoniae ATCC 51270]